MTYHHIQNPIILSYRIIHLGKFNRERPCKLFMSRIPPLPTTILGLKLISSWWLISNSYPGDKHCDANAKLKLYKAKDYIRRQFSRLVRERLYFNCFVYVFVVFRFQVYAKLNSRFQIPISIKWTSQWFHILI